MSKKFYYISKIITDDKLTFDQKSAYISNFIRIENYNSDEGLRDLNEGINIQFDLNDIAYNLADHQESLLDALRKSEEIYVINDFINKKTVSPYDIINAPFQESWEAKDINLESDDLAINVIYNIINQEKIDSDFQRQFYQSSNYAHTVDNILPACVEKDHQFLSHFLETYVNTNHLLTELELNDVDANIALSNHLSKAFNELRKKEIIFHDLVVKSEPESMIRLMKDLQDQSITLHDHIFNKAKDILSMESIDMTTQNLYFKQSACLESMLSLSNYGIQLMQRLMLHKESTYLSEDQRIEVVQSMCDYMKRMDQLFNDHNPVLRSSMDALLHYDSEMPHKNKKDPILQHLLSSVYQSDLDVVGMDHIDKENSYLYTVDLSLKSCKPALLFLEHAYREKNKGWKDHYDIFQYAYSTMSQQHSFVKDDPSSLEYSLISQIDIPAIKNIYQEIKINTLLTDVTTGFMESIETGLTKNASVFRKLFKAIEKKEFDLNLINPSLRTFKKMSIKFNDVNDINSVFTKNKSLSERLENAFNRLTLADKGLFTRLLLNSKEPFVHHNENSQSYYDTFLKSLNKKELLLSTDSMMSIADYFQHFKMMMEQSDDEPLESRERLYRSIDIINEKLYNNNNNHEFSIDPKEFL